MYFLKPDLLEKLLNFNIFLLILSFSLFLNIFVELKYDFSLVNIEVIMDWKSKGIDIIDWVYIFSFYCLFITGGMHFLRYIVGTILYLFGFLNLYEKDEHKVHIDEYHRISIKFNNMAIFNTYKDRLKEQSEIEKIQILCQSIVILIFVTLVSHEFFISSLLISTIDSLDFNVYILVNSIAALLAAFIIPMSAHKLDYLSYVDKSLIMPFLDEEDALKKSKLINESVFHEL